MTSATLKCNQPALGNPGKIVGMMYNERTRQWEPVEAAAGLGNQLAGKIVGFNPDTGEMYYALASGALGQDEPSWLARNWLGLLAVGLLGYWWYLEPR